MNGLIVTEEREHQKAPRAPLRWSRSPHLRKEFLQQDWTRRIRLTHKPGQWAGGGSGERSGTPGDSRGGFRFAVLLKNVRTSKRASCIMPRSTAGGCWLHCCCRLCLFIGFPSKNFLFSKQCQTVALKQELGAKVQSKITGFPPQKA